MKNIHWFLLISLLLTLSTYSVAVTSSHHRTPLNEQFSIATYPVDLSGVNIAVYEGYTSDLCTNSRMALYNMFTWMNATVDYLNSSQIYKNDEIWDYDILAIPDGLAPRFETRLGILGLDVIRDWVSKGGIYFGVRAGATLACAYSYFEGTNEEYHLKLFNGTGYGPLVELDDMCITDVNINTSALPSFSNAPADLDVLYRLSRYFEAAEGQDVIPIGHYDANDGLGMLAFHYGTGCGFITGLDPEFEENSDRDGTDFRDEFDDPDSEWPLMLDICRWMVSESYWNLTTTPIITPSTTSIETTSTTSMITTESTSEIVSQFPMMLVGTSSIAIVAVVAIIVFIRLKK